MQRGATSKLFNRVRDGKNHYHKVGTHALSRASLHVLMHFSNTRLKHRLPP